MTAIEGYLYNLEKDKAEHLTAFRCANCHYYETMTTDLGIPQPYCHRRERAIGWNPERFYCTEYGAGNGLDEWEERIFSVKRLTWRCDTCGYEFTYKAHDPINRRCPVCNDAMTSEFLDELPPRLVNPVQLTLDRWCA